ncbi:hypothetical protein ACFLIM_39245 [Nonomuraea sp. M3C6]|uniref:ANTAR domain-containing protein n=1 Tax=Nonomuraea marmarensis TaxID=3351344 RepID=A0ABW7ASN7_9ACTN
MDYETTRADVAAVNRLVSASAAAPSNPEEDPDLTGLIGEVVTAIPPERLVVAFTIVLRETLHELAEATGQPMDEVWQRIALRFAAQVDDET